MGWIVFLLLSVACLLGMVMLLVMRAKGAYKTRWLLEPSKVMFVGVFLSGIFLFVPVCANALQESNCGVPEIVLMSIHVAMRMFVLDGDYVFAVSNIAVASGVLAKIYVVLFAVLYVLAPISTFSFVLSFFKNISAYKRYITHFNTDTFIFSELNERSLALAGSLHRNNRNRLLIFTDVFEKEEEQSDELIKAAKELGAICFKDDIGAVDFSFHSKNSALNFFAIGADQTESVSQALRIIEKQKYRKNTNLYIFSTRTDAELLLSNAFGAAPGETKPVQIKVRRINEVQSLISRNLYENGYEKIFASAYDDGTATKKINAVILGMGEHGAEMTKALAWFCQMNGYLVQIDAFDRSPLAEQVFTAQVPELMQFSGKLDIEGEAKYTLNIHSGVDVDTKAFYDTLAALPRTTYVFVALGDDDKNISTAVKLRAQFERMNYLSEIQAVVYNSDKKEALCGITNFKGQPYNIDFIGDVRSSCSEEVVLGSDVEAAALQRHLAWGAEEEFWQYNYNYKSSIAAAIHHKMKILCGIPGAEKKPADRTDEERWPLRVLEHCRWNTYIRSEGYMYGGTTDKEGRNDLAKLHNCLVPFANLPLKEQEKDDD